MHRKFFVAVLVVKQELLRVNQRPDNVLVSLAFAAQRFLLLLVRALAGDVFLGQSCFLSRGFAGISRQVKLADFFFIAAPGVGCQTRRHAFVVGQFLLNLLGVQQMQALREAGVLRAFAFAGAR